MSREKPISKRKKLTREKGDPLGRRIKRSVRRKMRLQSNDQVLGTKRKGILSTFDAPFYC